MDTNSITDGPIPLMKAAPTVVVESVPAPGVGTPPPMPVAPTPQAAKGSWGGLIGIVLIVFVITLAAFYSWGERLATQSPNIEAETVE